MRGHTIWELSTMRAEILRAEAAPAPRRERRRVRRVVGVGLVRAGHRLLGARAS